MSLVIIMPFHLYHEHIDFFIINVVYDTVVSCNMPGIGDFISTP